MKVFKRFVFGFAVAVSLLIAPPIFDNFFVMVFLFDGEKLALWLSSALLILFGWYGLFGHRYADKVAFVLFWLYPGFATDDELFSDPKRCRYRTGTAERKCGEFGRFLHKRIDVIESVAGQGWTAHGQSVDFAASGDRVHRARTAATSWKSLVG